MGAMRRLLAVTCGVAIMAASAVQAATQPSCMGGAARRDCGYMTESLCAQNGCCWTPIDSVARAANLTPDEMSSPPEALLQGNPWCYHPQSIVGGYAVAAVVPTPAGSGSPPGWTLQLKLTDGNGYFGTDEQDISVQVSFETKQRLRVRIYDPYQARWEIPTSILPLAPADSTLNVNDTFYSFSWTNEPFGFAVTRVDDGEVIFNSTAPLAPDGATPLFNGLVFSDQYLEISTQLPPAPVLYGLGEKVTSLQLETKGNPVTFWARDAASPVDQNMYGSHPFYIEHRRTVATKSERARGLNSTFTTKSHGVWLRNSNGMDVLIYDASSAVDQWKLNNPEAAAKTQLQDGYDAGYLTYRVIGGVLDFFIYVGSSSTGTSHPLAITQQYQTSVGLPHMPPLWSLGFHQCRWGYPNLAAVETMVEQYAAAKIPLDTAWTDIDYMDAYEDFSTDPVNFPSAAMTTFIEKLHAQGQHYMVIIDPAIHNRTGYSTFEAGLAKDVFIKQASGEVFVGKVWPGYTAFPSFYAANTAQWWSDSIAAFRKLVPVDGLWIDMNEASNFCNGDCDSPTWSAEDVLKQGATCAQARKHLHGAADAASEGRNTHRVATESVKRPSNSAPAPLAWCDGSNGNRLGTCLPNNPPYRINNAASGAPLNTLTIDMDSTHGSQKWLEYDVHNMYGFSESIATNAALESNTGQRTLVVSRSTFSGSGHHVSHWLGDNFSTWESMGYSIAGILAMGFFGVPMVGADICGFNGDTTEELCARWMALGSFYPFSRNHNSKGQISQEPYTWASVTEVSQLTLGARYSLVHVYNTLFFQAATRGGSVARPLSFNFAQDVTTFNIDAQFMIGSSVLVTPVLAQGVDAVEGYWPPVADDGSPALWYDFWSGAPFQQGSTGWAVVSAPLSTIPVHIAGGNILPLQQPALNLQAQSTNPFVLVVAPNAQGCATGNLFLDDGLTLQVGNNSLQSSFAYASKSLIYAVGVDGFPAAASLIFAQIDILGFAAAPAEVQVNSAPAQFSWAQDTFVLRIANLTLPLNQKFSVVVS